MAMECPLQQCDCNTYALRKQCSNLAFQKLNTLLTQTKRIVLNALVVNIIQCFYKLN